MKRALFPPRAEPKLVPAQDPRAAFRADLKRGLALFGRRPPLERLCWLLEALVTWAETELTQDESLELLAPIRAMQREMFDLQQGCMPRLLAPTRKSKRPPVPSGDQAFEGTAACVMDLLMRSGETERRAAQQAGRMLRVDAAKISGWRQAAMRDAIAGRSGLRVGRRRRLWDATKDLAGPAARDKAREIAASLLRTKIE